MAARDVLIGGAAALGAAMGWWLPLLAARLALIWGYEPFTSPGEPPPDAPAPLSRVAFAIAAGAAGVTAIVTVGLNIQLLLVLAMLAWLLVVAAFDVWTHRIPNRLTYPAVIVSPLVLTVWSDGDIVGHVAGAVVVGGLLALAFVASPRGLGFGDVKLGVVIGLYLGLGSGLVALVVGIMFGATMALGLLLLGHGRRAVFPYGPALAAGGAVGLLVGERLWRAYLLSRGMG